MSKLFDFDDREKEHLDREVIKRCQAFETEDIDRPVETDEGLRAVNRLKFKKKQVGQTKLRLK